MKLTIQSLMVVTALLVGQSTFGQSFSPEKRNSFRAGIGMGYARAIDLQYSPNVYQSWRQNLDLGYYRNIGGIGIFNVELGVRLGSLKPTHRSVQSVYISETDFYGEEDVDIRKLEFAQMGASLEVGYLHPVKTTANFKILVGGGLIENLTYTPSVIYIGTINYGSFNARAQVDYTFNNGKVLSAGLSFPLVSSVTRMPYHNSPVFPDEGNFEAFFDDNSETASFKNFQNETFYICYNWFVGRKLTMDVRFETNYLYYGKPEEMANSSNQISLGFNF